jgi:hypothetical protein
MAEKDKGAKVPLEKIVKLLTVAKEEHTKIGDVLNEIDALLEGRASIAQQLKEAYASFDRAWSSRYAPEKPGSYIWRYQVDGPNMKRLLRHLTPDEIGRRAIVFLHDGDPALRANRHPFAWFVTRVNQYADAVEAGAFELVPDCKHKPPCRSDTEHTKRRSAELRGSHSGPVGDVL